MTDPSVDRDLRDVFDGLVTAIYLAKQLVWSAPPSRREQLQDLLDFLVDQSHRVDEAEARIDGRAAAIRSPSSHQRPNLLGDLGNDVQAALEVYTDHVTDLVSDIRGRASAMDDVEEATLLTDIAEGLEGRVRLLRSCD